MTYGNLYRINPDKVMDELIINLRSYNEKYGSMPIRIEINMPSLKENLIETIPVIQIKNIQLNHALFIKGE